MPLVKKYLDGRLNLKIKANCRYSQNTYLKLLVHTAINKNYAEGGSADFKHKCNLDGMIYGFEPFIKNCPDGDTLLYHIKKFNDDELYPVFDSINEGIVQQAIRAGTIPPMVTVAIDCTDVPYYGKKTDPMVVGKKPEKGTNYSHRYASITIVEGGLRYTLKTLAVSKHVLISDVVSALLLDASKLVKISHVLLDRGFYTVDVITVLKKHDYKFVIPGKMTPPIVDLIRKQDVPAIKRHKIGTRSKFVYANLVVVNDTEGKKCAFITNIEDFNAATALCKTADEIFKVGSPQYSKRWGIETTYRVTKHDFLAKTTSKNPVVRLFYMLLAVCLYNLWQLANMRLPESPVQKVKKYELPARIFGAIVLGCLRMFDSGPPKWLIAPYSGSGTTVAG
ncbi:transposase [Methanoregula boonei]|jgi:hypothetical protein|nr:transposase [Methanoregula boonei]